MRPVTRHLARTFLSGVVALLPIGGLLLGFQVAERAIADSWLAGQAFYFPGLGILAVLVGTYLIGLTLTTLVGKFAWRLVDGALDSMPLVGVLYRTLKQVVGYGEGKDAMFERVVLVPGRDRDSAEIGLVTNTLPAQDDGTHRLLVFVPAVPTPTSGRLVVIEEEHVHPMEISVHEALKLLVGIGTLEAPEEARTATFRSVAHDAEHAPEA